MKNVVRVATNNNFNCTKKEWDQLKTFTKKYPNKTFFVNSNILTPLLHTISNHDYKAVVTANPCLVIPPDSLTRLNKIKHNIAFVRVKYLPDRPEILTLVGTLLQQSFPIVLTLQRFNSKKTLAQYTNPAHYAFSNSRFRLKGEPLTTIVNLVTDLRETLNMPVWICDQSGKGCPGCGLCSKLTTGQDLKIKALNLSTSGICPYNCPDCYAKTMQRFSTAMGHAPILYDKILQNDKQAGRTAHIKENNHA